MPNTSGKLRRPVWKGREGPPEPKPLACRAVGVGLHWDDRRPRERADLRGLEATFRALEVAAVAEQRFVAKALLVLQIAVALDLRGREMRLRGFLREHFPGLAVESLQHHSQAAVRQSFKAAWGSWATAVEDLERALEQPHPAQPIA